MNKTTEALKLAENALRDIIRVYKFEGGAPVTALAAIREALAEQEKQEVDLTDAEIQSIYAAHHDLGGCWTDGFEYERAVIAAFKEKNK